MQTPSGGFCANVIEATPFLGTKERPAGVPAGSITLDAVTIADLSSVGPDLPIERDVVRMARDAAAIVHRQLMFERPTLGMMV